MCIVYYILPASKDFENLGGWRLELEVVMSDNANPPTRPPVAMRNSFRGVFPVDVRKSLLLNFRVQGSVLVLCNRGSYCNKKKSE